MEIAGKHLRCPVCGHPTIVASAATAARRAQRPVESFRGRLSSYRVCQSCSILFKVSYLDSVLLRLLPGSQPATSIPLPPPREEERSWTAEELEHYSNIHPVPVEPPMEFVPLPQQQQMRERLPEFQLRINNSLLGVHIDIEIGGGQIWSGMRTALGTALHAISQAIEALATVQQHGQHRPPPAPAHPLSEPAPRLPEAEKTETSITAQPQQPQSDAAPPDSGSADKKPENPSPPDPSSSSG